MPLEETLNPHDRSERSPSCADAPPTDDRAPPAHAGCDVPHADPRRTHLAERVTDADTAPEVFGSFWIGRTEFALPVGVIQEVVNEPAGYSQVPLSPPHVRGLFNLRRMIIPVIDLRVLLGFPAWPDANTRKIAIIENGPLCIGLLFDTTGGIINGADVARVIYPDRAQRGKDVVIEGVLKLDNGARMVQMLDPYALLNIEKLPRVAKQNLEEKTRHLGQRRNCITFQLGQTACAIDLRFVQEVTEVPELQASQVAHGNTIGNVELRGTTMPVVDFRGLMGANPLRPLDEDELSSFKLIVMHLPEGLVGLVVHSIDNIMTFYDGDILPFASVALPRHDLLTGCLVNTTDEIVILLDHDKLMRDSSLVAAARSCRDIYPSKPTKDDAVGKSETSSVRGTYVLFRVEVPLAFDLSCVNEIIDRPQKVLQPPYALDFVDGVFYLRGEIITLINPRVLYGLSGVETADPKVIIVHMGDVKYGMLVDSVDEILTVQKQEYSAMPSIITATRSRIVSEDVNGCLQIPARGLGSDPILVLDVGKLISRCIEAESH